MYFFTSAVRHWSDHQYCLYLLAGMAELHPEECRSRLYRVGQRRQVSDTTYRFISSLFTIGHFPVSPVLHRFADPLPKSLSWPGGSLWFWVKKNQWSLGGRLKCRLGEEGWTIFEFKSPFNICPSQWELGKGERSGRRWEGFWSLVPLWHIGNGSWFPPVLLSVFVFLVYLPVGIFAVCHCLVFFALFFDPPQKPSLLPNKILSIPHQFHLQAIQFTLLIFRINNYQTLIHSNSNKAGDVDLWVSWGELDLKSI